MEYLILAVFIGLIHFGIVLAIDLNRLINSEMEGK